MIKPKKGIEKLSAYPTDLYRKQWRLKLDSNENIYGASNAVLNTVKNINPEDICLYPCYGKLCDKLCRLYGLNEDNIILTNGCDEALNIIINTYIEKGDEFLSYNPSFSMPALYAQIAGAEVKQIDYDEKFVFDKDKIAINITDKTKIVYIATPNNPTGEIVRASLIELLVKDFQDTLFIIDCTYINFSYNSAFEDYLDLIKNNYNVIAVKSFSKDYALAGLRIGFASGHSEVISNIKKIASPYNVNSVALSCAITALNDNKTLEEIKCSNETARELLYKGLQEKGFKPYPSEGNFILCDFFESSEFYYEKLRKNGVITRKFSKDSSISTCLRITVPKPGGVKYILELLNKKDMLIFDLDGVVFDVRDSYISAIAETFKYFSKQEISKEEIFEVKNLGGMNCDWDATKYLLEKYGYNISLEDVIAVFQNLFYNPKVKKENYLIDKEKLLIPKEVFERLSYKYDLVIFSGRLKDEVRYSLEKFGIDKYFYYFVTSDDLSKNMLKPHPKGVLNILKHCPHLSIKYLGDSVDDIIAGNSANVETIGIVSPGADYNIMRNNFRHLGAKYMLDDVKNIESFLDEIGKNYVKES